MGNSHTKDVAEMMRGFAESDEKQVKELQARFAGKPIPGDVQKVIEHKTGMAAMMRATAEAMLKLYGNTATSQSNESLAAQGPDPRAPK